MPSIDSSMTVGVFKDKAQAQQALASLQSAGFDQIQFLDPDRPVPQSGGLFSSIKRLFGGDNEEGITGNLKDTGVSEVDARYYQQEYEAGRTIITVRADERKQDALDILRRYGAYDAFTRNVQAQDETTATSTASTTDTTSVQTADASTAPTADITSTGTADASTAPTAETPSAQTAGASTTSSAETVPTSEVASGIDQETDEESNIPLTPPTDDMTGVYDQRHIDLNAEQLNVNKQPVQTGQVELHKDVVTEQRSVDVPVTHEEVFVERHPVSATTNDTTPIGQDEEIRVPVTEEHVEVTKTPVITGEASIEKRAIQETQRVSGTTKREKLRVEQEGEAPIHDTPSDRFHYKKKQNNQAGKPRAKSRKKH